MLGRCVRMFPSCVRTVLRLLPSLRLLVALLPQSIAHPPTTLFLEQRRERILNLCERNANAFRWHCDRTRDGFRRGLDGALVLGVLPHPAHQFVVNPVCGIRKPASVRLPLVRVKLEGWGFHGGPNGSSPPPAVEGRANAVERSHGKTARAGDGLEFLGLDFICFGLLQPFNFRHYCTPAPAWQLFFNLSPPAHPPAPAATPATACPCC